jgi:ketosteroid isomerase-like protein
MQAGDVFRPVAVVEDVEQRAVDDRVVAGLAAQVHRVGDRLFAAIEGGDAAAVEALWDDDVLVWKSAQPQDQAKKRAFRVIAWFMDTTTKRRYEILDRQFFNGGSVQKHVLHGTGRNGGLISMRVCLIIKLEPTA